MPTGKPQERENRQTSTNPAHAGEVTGTERHAVNGFRPRYPATTSALAASAAAVWRRALSLLSSLLTKFTDSDPMG